MGFNTPCTAVSILSHYYIALDLPYVNGASASQCLDVYYRKGATKDPRPTLVFYHGGGWCEGSKEQELLHILPYLEAGWNAVNVEYRLADEAPAPAAVEDACAALEWVFNNADSFGFEKDKIVLCGSSAGGHLALMAGMTPGEHYSEDRATVAAIINWFGITDVVDLLSESPQLENHQREFAVSWLAEQSEQQNIAQSVSPLSYVRSGLPPILTIHGDQDELVPYSHAVRLHQALDSQQVPNELVTVTQGGHGEFSEAQMLSIFKNTSLFLNKHLPVKGIK